MATEGERETRELAPEVMDALSALNGYFFRETVLSTDCFGRAIKRFLDKNPTDFGAHNSYFEYVGGTWLQLQNAGNYRAAQQIWELALEPIHAWETTNSPKGYRVHKGTAYYFWAAAYLSAGDIDRGFILMHRALEEDVLSSRNQNPPTPAYSFVTLDYDNPKQFLLNWVKEGANYLEAFLAKYRATRNKNLSLKDFKDKLLTEPALRQTTFLFVYLLHRLRALERSKSERLIDTQYGAYLVLDLCFGFCLVTDQVIKWKYVNPRGKKVVLFRDLALFLSSSAHLNMDGTKMDTINDEFGRHLDKAIIDVLGGSVGSMSLGHLEADIALCYGIRNQAAHSIPSPSVLVSRFEEVVQAVLNMLFLAVEELYK